MKKNIINLKDKLNLTIEEASIYSGIGINRLRELTERPDCDFVIMKGYHRLIKRKQFEAYNDKLTML